MTADGAGRTPMYGADPQVANDAGQTPVGLARLIASVDVARFFSDLP
jgi:uncharacterized protein